MPRGPLLAACGVALGLHLAMGLSLWPLFATSPRHTPPPVLAVRLLAAPAPAALVAAAEPHPAPDTGDAAAAAHPMAHAPDRPASDVRLAAPDFLASDEVDAPARPATAWTLDAEGLAALGITRIVFDTWVDATATLVNLRVVSMEPASTETLAPMVEARLAATAMVAAHKQGQPVAHVQRVDLGWERVKGPAG